MDSPILPQIVGPFIFDHELKLVTLTAGIYDLTKPITFGIVEATKITNIIYQAKSCGIAGIPLGVGWEGIIFGNLVS